LAPWSSPSPGPASRWFPGNRRDGSRLLSSALVIAGAGLVRFDHPIGRAVFVGAGLFSLFGWLQYRRLTY
jgi:hypothetical protein